MLDIKTDKSTVRTDQCGFISKYRLGTWKNGFGHWEWIGCATANSPFEFQLEQLVDLVFQATKKSPKVSEIWNAKIEKISDIISEYIWYRYIFWYIDTDMFFHLATQLEIWGLLGHHQDHPKAPKSEVKPKAAKESRSQSVGAMLTAVLDGWSNHGESWNHSDSKDV